MVTWLLASAAIVSVVVVWQARDSLRPGFAGWYLVAVGLLHHAPTAAAKITNSYVYGRDFGGEISVVGLGWADQLYRIADLGVVVATVALLVYNAVSKRLTIAPPAVFMLGLVALGIFSRVVVFESAPSGQPLLLLVAMVAAGTASTTFRQVASGGAVLALTVALSSTILALVRPESALSACLDKCTIIGQVFTGTSSHGNALALFITLGLPFVWLAFSGAGRLWMTTYLVFLVAISGSRTSLAVAALVVLVLLLARPQLTGHTATARAPGFVKATALAVAATGILLPLVVRDDLFATGRGYLWRVALQNIEEKSPLIGLGSQSWQRLYDLGLFGEAAAYATHNQWLEALLIGGLVGGVLLAAAVIAFLWQDDPAKRAVTSPLVIAILALGIFERPIGIDLISSTTWAFLGLLMLSNASAEVSRPPATEGRKVTLSSSRRLL